MSSLTTVKVAVLGHHYLQYYVTYSLAYLRTARLFDAAGKTAIAYSQPV